jgi:mono/diheme cytochrome c family protein
MVRKLIGVVVAVAVVTAVTLWGLTSPATVPASALGAHTVDLNNGRTMFLAGGCSSCHAVPKQNDRTRLGGGLALNSPFGTFYVPNISPDRRDGIGAWTEAQFVTAMTQGTSPDGDHLYPAFPYPSYRNMTDGDLRDLFAYLKTLPAVQGKVRGHNLRFPFNVRRLVGVWKLIYLRGALWHPDPKESAQWNRGAYLVNGPGHCAECHSPRDALGGIVAGKRFTGGPSPSGQGGVPNITQFKLKNWSVDDIAFMLEDGNTPDADRVGGEMVEVVRNTSQLSKDDRMAMALYIKSLPPVAGMPQSNK